MGQDHSNQLDNDTPTIKLAERSLSGVAKYIQSECKSGIVVMTGAGLSTAAGIPDFRSPNTGLYANLARLKLPYAEAVFDISYFEKNPDPFYVLAKELYPGNYSPTVSHVFISLLAKKNLLKMLFTQNIDCLERQAGVPGDLIIEAHGSFATQRCIDCSKEFPDDHMKEHVLQGIVPRCKDKKCNGYVKPDIVFFGESLPKAFNDNRHLPAKADLVLVMGTSLTVHPFAGLPEVAHREKPRVLFNMERVGTLGTRPDDVVVLGDCDSSVRKLASELGWRDELETEWRRVVGHKEAERQLRSVAERESELQDELEGLADKVAEGLHIDDNHSSDDDGELQSSGEANDVPDAGGPETSGETLEKVSTPSEREATSKSSPSMTESETGTDAEAEPKNEASATLGEATTPKPTVAGNTEQGATANKPTEKSETNSPAASNKSAL
ncbi:NAD-dependent deacetylase sirtuin-2 [Coniella lustricola]|uniref:NAD-dependent deacetylase sirtuin-2 n=1 Tax=Coniella lustricola TaxID=2025994 RepID=A0A2T3ALF7_9PEZI|nr:NAD-dependent deacetylase sirtuin-2 [Coniella lustricola]